MRFNYIFIVASILLSCMSCNTTTTKQEVFRNDDLVITELEDKVWVVETTDQTTMYIIEGNDKAMLIDTGTKCEALDEVVRKITQKPLIVVITHNHGDHSGNVHYFDEAYLHPADTVLTMATPYQGKWIYMQEGDVFDLGGKRLEVFLMPGHTPGSIILVDKDANACYTGDAFGSGQVWLQLKPATPMIEYARSCERMEKIMDDQNITKIYCGHYPHVKRALDKDYVTRMKNVAHRIASGDVADATPYPMKVGSDNPMALSDGTVTIVYDPDYIN